MKSTGVFDPNHRILIIDDNQAIHNDLRKILLGNADTQERLQDDEAVLFGEEAVSVIRFEIDSAYQGQEGLAKLEQSLAEGRPYALAFVDVRMPPGWNGIETVTHLWRTSPNLQVVVCTAYSDYSWNDMQRRLGRSEKLLIIKKPFDNIEVIQLAHALTHKWLLSRQAEAKMADLDLIVAERTAQLRNAHEQIEHEFQRSAKAQEAFRIIFQASTIGIALVDNNGRYVDVNGAFERQFEFTRDQLVGKSPAELGAVKHLSLLPLHEAIDRTPTVEAEEITCQCRNGWRTGLLWTREVEIHDCLHRICLVLDITDRKEMEEELRRARIAAEASEATYRALFDNMLNCLCNVRLIFDGERVVDFEYLAVNQAFAARRGIPSPVGKRATDLIPGIVDTDPGWFELLGRVARTGVPESCDLWLEAMKECYAFAAYSQGPDRVVFLFDVITERKRAEEALRASERLLAESQRVAQLGSWAVELPGYQVTWSEEAYRIWGVSPQTPNASFEAFRSLIHPDDIAAMREWTRACLAGEDPADLEFRAVRSDGTSIILNGRGALVRDEECRPVRMTGTIQDVTERKRAQAEKAQLEAQFHQAQKMESVGRLAGGVAHDFNNLLTVINGYSQMLLTDLRPSDPLRDSVQEIRKAGERAAGLTRQLLAFSRKQVLKPRRLNVNRVLEEVRPMLERLVGEDIEVRVVLSALGGTINADPSQLEQVVMNLVVNARDAMPGTGKLLIETAMVARDENNIRLHPEARVGRYVMLAVSDTGEGMDEETKKRIFEPFFTTKAMGKGTGLGLSTVQGIVAQSGGYLEVYSEKGTGTTFKIYLPALAAGEADTAVPVAMPAVGGKETVLIVEDQGEVRNFAVAVLKGYGYRVIPAENADDALLFCERERIDLVLTDVVMPHVSGRELADRLETLRPGIKVLFMSGYTDNVIEHHGVLEEGAWFIQKPFSPEDLAAKVRTVLGLPTKAPPARILVADDEAACAG